jgi:hypothetical protein
MVMMRTATETEEKTSLKRYFGTFLSLFVCKQGVRIVVMTQREAQVGCRNDKTSADAT